MNSNSIEHFSKVIEKLSKNKLSKSNAFENRIVDYVGDLLETENATEIDWIKYSAGLDSCGKIYAYCVDSLFYDINQIISALNLNKPKDLTQELNPEEKSSKIKKSLNGGTTLEKLENISIDSIEKSNKTDYVFKSYSKRFDASSFSGLLLNFLSISSSLDLEIDQNQGPNCEIFEHNEKIELNLEAFDLKARLVEGLPETFMKSFEEKVNLEDFEDLANRMDEDLEGEGEESEESESEEVVEVREVQEVFEDFRRFDQGLNSVGNGIQAFSGKKNDWAGLDYWKNIRKVPLAKKKHIDNPIILSSSFDLSNSDLFKKSKTKYTNYYSEKAIDNMKENLPFLPEDHHYSSDYLTRLYTFPKTSSLLEKQNSSNEMTEYNQEFSAPDKTVIKSSLLDSSGQIRYCMNSKTVNIKSLKEKIWSSLDTSIKSSDHSFLSIIKDLPEKIDQNELQNLSIHTCFITFLHLANENNLYLKPSGNCDFFIGPTNN